MDFGVERTDADANNVVADHCGCVDIWSELLPDEPGYTYDGKFNMSDAGNIRRRSFRLLCTPDLLPFATRISAVGLSPVKGAKVATRGGLNEHKLHPSSRYGLSADFVFGGRRAVQRASGFNEIPPVSAPAQSTPIREARAPHKANFADREVDAKAIRLALRSLGVCPPEDRSLAATFDMFRIAFPDRAARSKKCKRLDLKAALRHLNLPLSGKKPQLVDRISNAFSLRGSQGGAGQDSQDIAEAPLGSAPSTPPKAGFDVGNEGVGHSRPSVPCLDDSIAAGKKPSNPTRVPAIHEPARVAITSYAEEASSNFINLFDDGLAEDFYWGDEKDVNAECEALLKYKYLINNPSLCAPGYTRPVDLPHFEDGAVAAVLRRCAARWAHCDVDTDDMDPTQLAAFRHVAEWAGKRKLYDASGGKKPSPLRLTIPGTAGAGKTRLLTAIAGAVRGVFGSEDSVVVGAHTGMAASNVGGGGRTLAGLFRTMGDSEPEHLTGDRLRELKKDIGRCRLLIIDEISMAGSQQLAAVSVRLQQVIDLLPSFGGCGVIFPGDFAQLPPIGQKSLLFDGPPRKCERGLTPRASGTTGGGFPGKTPRASGSASSIAKATHVHSRNRQCASGMAP